ncbi:MAG: phosphate/phosphite/phosphonate ABC transporter substrate-binding protein [Candidatus Limnocylindria bacterium]
MLWSRRGPLALALAAALILGACSTAGTGGTAGASGSPKASGARLGSFDRPIVLAITPSAEVAKLTTTGNAIASALATATGLRWKVIVPTSYAAEIESVCAGQTDIAFIAPLQMTLLLDKDCGSPILAALRNDETGKLSPTYNSQIVVRTDSGITDLGGLKGKRFAFVDAISTSGYLFPSLVVKQKTGQEPKTFFSQTIFAGGHPQSILALYNGQVDGAASFVDARVKVPGGTDVAAGMPADVLAKTKVIDKAGPIPNDGIALRKDFPADVAAQVKKALLDYAGTDGGKGNLKTLFAWDGIQEVQANFYDSVRDAAKLAGIDVAGEAAKTPRPAATPSPSPSKSP